MLKRTLALAMVLVLVLSCSLYYVSAEVTMPTSLEKPQSLAVRTEGASEFKIRWTNPASILKLNGDIEGEGHSLYYVIDWKKNDGSWNIGDITPSSSNYNDEIHGYFLGYLGNIQQDENGSSENFLVTWHFDPNAEPGVPFDLKNNTYYFRMRYVLEYFDNEKKPLLSPYTDVVAIGKGIADTIITKLDAPKDLKVEVKKDSNGKPYFQLNWMIPDSISEANKQLPVSHVIDFKVGDGKWLSETISWDWMPVAPSGLLANTDTFNPVEKTRMYTHRVGHKLPYSSPMHPRLVASFTCCSPMHPRT